jgi:uncharacterized protein YukE
MAKQGVNTECVATAANKLRSVNNTINTQFNSLQSKAKKLDSNWNSKAGDNARTTMHEIFKNNEPRGIVLQNYINFLEQQINPGYVDTENTNTSLAGKFK